MKKISRRTSLKNIGIAGASPLIMTSKTGAKQSPGSAEINIQSNEIFAEIYKHVQKTPFIDTHEHLIEEAGRLSGTKHPRVQSDDWTMILSHYFDSDLLSAGMKQNEYDNFFSPRIDPVDKWKIFAPYWPFVKNTGYGQAVQITLKELYGVERLSAETIKAVQDGYNKTRKPGFYAHILKNLSNIESCQVNSLEDTPFQKTAMPLLLMQDISLVWMYAWLEIKKLSKPTGITPESIDDWYHVIDWWFKQYGQYAAAVKSQHAYSRDIDYIKIPKEKIEKSFLKLLNNENISAKEQKDIQDHLFWYVVQKSNEYNLPVKLHTGYYAGQNNMPLSRLINNAGSATELCLLSPETRFVFMHICYPYYEELLAAAKNFSNAYVDMCWSWIINPIAAKDFLKKYLVTAPANKILTFGGDYIPVEPVLGHARIARRGIAQALSELIAEGWINMENAFELSEFVMHKNARSIFNLAEKEKRLGNKPW